MVAISPMPSIKPPSPTKPITFLSGLATEAPIAVARPKPIAPASEWMFWFGACTGNKRLPHVLPDMVMSRTKIPS